MHLVCLDLEGVLVPEIWIAFSEHTSIPELRLTTRDMPDYDLLMRQRLALLAQHGMKLPDIQKVIGKMEPLPGALEFLDELRRLAQVIILSDTFTQFASPLMEKLGWPTIFCNSLSIDPDGSVVGYHLRVKDGKREAVRALRSIGFKVIASGDSYNDISMLEASDCGILFRPPDPIRSSHSHFPIALEYPQLLELIKEAVVG